MERYSIVAESGWEDFKDDNGEWVKYEDVKGLELQVMTLTEQLSKMERRQSKQFDIDDNGFYERMTGKLLDHIIL
jgi:hypothetical protein